MRALREGNPAYRAVTVMRVDWDTHRDAAITTRLGVRRRSTLVMFSGGEEVGRVVAETRPAPIAALFDAALQGRRAGDRE